MSGYCIQNGLCITKMKPLSENLQLLIADFQPFVNLVQPAMSLESVLRAVPAIRAANTSWQMPSFETSNMNPSVTPLIVFGEMGDSAAGSNVSGEYLNKRENVTMTIQTQPSILGKLFLSPSILTNSTSYDVTKLVPFTNVSADGTTGTANFVNPYVPAYIAQNQGHQLTLVYRDPAAAPGSKYPDFTVTIQDATFSPMDNGFPVCYNALDNTIQSMDGFINTLGCDTSNGSKQPGPGPGPAPNPNPTNPPDTMTLSPGAIAGITIGSAALIVGIVLASVYIPKALNKR